MSLAIVIDSKLSRFNAVEAVKNITSEPIMEVVIREYSDDRTAAQNRLLWAWLTDAQNTTANTYAGNVKEWWHLFFKEHSLLNIYIRDNVAGTAETMAALYDVKINCGVETYNNMRKFVINNISTTDANISQFSEYLRDIERFCNTVGIKLRTDTHIYRRAIGV